MGIGSGQGSVLISGLRRSGTTILWRILKQDKRFDSFNEPFHPEITRHITQRHEAYADYCPELIGYQKKNGGCIDLCDEGVSELTDSSISYLRWLTSKSKSANINFVRTVFKTEALCKEFPDALHIFIYRRPSGFVSSHLKPLYRNSGTVIRVFRELENSRKFWSRKTGYNAFQYEDLLEMCAAGIVTSELRLMGIDSELEDVPAYVKMLALWRKAYRHVIHCQQDLGLNIMFVNLEEFIKNPNRIMNILYERLGLQEPPQFNFDQLYPANLGYKPASVNWQKYKIEEIKNHQ